MSIVMIGFASCGKSATGMRLAARLGYEFVDLDRRLEALHQRRTGAARSCREIFAALGEAAFVELEGRALRELGGRREMVLSTGGRTPLHVAHREILARLGTVIYLRSEPEAIYVRMGGKGMPTFMDGDHRLLHLVVLWQERDPLYAAAADLVVDNTALTVDGTVDWVVELLRRTPSRQADAEAAEA